MGAPWKHRTDESMLEAGYERQTPNRRCTYHPCTMILEIWRTPKGKLMPFHRLPDDRLEPHFAGCAGNDERNARRKAGLSQEEPIETQDPPHAA